MNRMFLSFLNSMQTNSQNAQNPGLWVNGNRMPTNLNEMFPPGQERDSAEANSPMPPKYLQLPGSEEEADKNERKRIEQKRDEREQKRDERFEEIATAVKRIPPRYSSTGDVAIVQKQTENEEAAQLAATAKANPYLTDRMKEDPRNHAALIRAGKMTQEEADRLNNIDSINIARGNLGGGGRAPGAMQPEPMQENTNRSMFLTHLQGMQTKSQDAQNPGLWVNGMRQPIQENEKRAQKIIDWNHNGVISKAENELTDFAKGQIAADDADIRAEHYAEMNFDERQRERMREAEGAEYEFHASADRYDPREGMAPDSEDLHNPGKISSFMKKKPMQENTNRSMFLTHLQSMQTKSQDAQNPGLWVNGNRMPMHENTPGGGTPAGASPEEFAKARAANPFRVRLGRGRPAGAQDLNRDGQVSKAEQELIARQLGDPLEDTVPTKAENTAKKLTKNFFDEHM